MAYADNRDLALLSGINPERVVMYSSIITAALATIAGALYGLDKSFKPFTYFQLLLPLFAAAIVGGIGKPVGAIVGGFVIAFSEVTITYPYKKFLTYLMPEGMQPSGLVQLLSTDYKFAVSFIILVIVLMVTPTGIMKGKNRMNLSANARRATLAFMLIAIMLVAVGVIQSWAVMLTIFNLCLISSIMALGVNIQWGYAGLFNVGTMGFAALGGVAAMLVSQEPVIAAWHAGGWKLLLSFVSLVLVIFLVAILYGKIKKGPFGNWRSRVLWCWGIFCSAPFLTRPARRLRRLIQPSPGIWAGWGYRSCCHGLPAGCWRLAQRGS